MKAQPAADARPGASRKTPDAIAHGIETLLTCARACTACADACLGESDVAKLAHCIRLDLDCADVCIATARLLTRQGDTNAKLRRLMLKTCHEACQACAEECDRHAAMHVHCRRCAEACHECADVCAAAGATAGTLQ